MDAQLENFQAIWIGLNTRQREKAAEWAMREATTEIHKECLHIIQLELIPRE